MTIKFWQITVGKNILFALDQYGRIWELNLCDRTWSTVLSPIEDREKHDGR